jgi:alkylation response protein AidB-like acyl-CoA dehydrogenase
MEEGRLLESRITMQQAVEQTTLPVDIDRQPIVRAAVALQPIARQYKDEIELGQRLPTPLVAQLREAGLYSLTVPRTLGGQQADPLTYVRVVELMAESVGSVGWNLANNGIVQLIALGLPDDGVQEVFAQGPDTIVAGTAVQGGGQAVPVDGGYRVSGRWRFGSGCQESSWMLGSFEILDNDQPRRGSDGRTKYWRGYFHRSECTVIDGSWDVAGVRGTGSFDWTVEDVFIPERRIMVHAGAPLDNQWSRWPGISYDLPTQAWIGPHHSAVATGIARAGINALLDLAGGGKTPRGRDGTMLRDNPQVQDWVGRAEALLGAGQAYRSAAIADVWRTVAAGEETTLEQRARCRLASTHAGESARQALDLMYRAGGSSSYQRSQPLAEAWRDFNVVSQTVTVLPEWYPLGGRVFLGLDPGSRLR